MRHAPGLILVAIFCFCVFRPNVSAAEGYELHEWGVFPIARNDAWAMSDLRAEWASFPDFFYRIWPDKRLPWRGAVDKPVIFFHGPAGTKIEFQVRFSEGRPLVWWPAALYPGDGLSQKQTDVLDYRLTLDDGKDVLPISKDHWVQALRDVKSSRVVTEGSWSGKRNVFDAEKFVYYDGIMKAPAAPKVAREKGALLLETENDFDLLDVLVIDRSLDGKNLSVGKSFIEKIAAGKQSTRIEMISVPEGEARTKKQAELLAEVQTRITAAGLNADEAESLIKVWRDGFLANKGMLVLYRVPQATYEKWLPLTAKPAPAKTVRVGLVLHTHLEPELDAYVEALIKTLSNDNFAERAAAQEALARIGGAAFPMLEKNSSNPDAETATACRELIKALDTRPAMKEAVKVTE
jgi:hypothetical protein